MPLRCTLQQPHLYQDIQSSDDPQACERYLIGFAIVVMSMQNEGQNWVFATESREVVTNPAVDWVEYFSRKMEDMNVPFMLRLPPAMVSMYVDVLVNVLCRRLTIALRVHSSQSNRLNYDWCNLSFFRVAALAGFYIFHLDVLFCTN